MPKVKRAQKQSNKRFGAGELFGRAVASLPPAEIRQLSQTSHKTVICPFKADNAQCHKSGGVCTLALYERDAKGTVSISPPLITTCPSRFLEKSIVFKWVGETLLGNQNAKIVSEISFLMSESGQEGQSEDEVGRIDNVLVDINQNRLEWCALEKQAVYFSGNAMRHEFMLMRTWQGPGIPFPVKHRRPDFRSSGPKRLMPQLQIKVPTLRRWGKKMAVVVDWAFWNSLGGMQRVQHLSNADIGWFVVDYDGPTDGHYSLGIREVFFTTLEDAVKGLTGGVPVSLEQFEQAIRQKLERHEAN